MVAILSRPQCVEIRGAWQVWRVHPQPIDFMITSSNGIIFRVTDPSCGEFTGHRWIPRTKASDAELCYFLCLCLNKQSSKQSWVSWFETPSCSLWRHCDVVAGPSDLATKYSLAPAVRAKHWQDENYIPRECQGQLVRGICVYGVGDLPWLAKRRELAANKFYLTFHYIALDCLEERHRNRTKLKDRVGAFLDEDYYRGLPTVLYSRKDGLWTWPSG